MNSIKSLGHKAENERRVFIFNVHLDLYFCHSPQTRQTCVTLIAQIIKDALSKNVSAGAAERAKAPF